MISEVSDDRFLLQWAGPKYTYPLDFAQLNDTLRTAGLKAFKATKELGSETIGHIQLMDIDYKKSICVFGRVLVFQEFRGRGFGNKLVMSAVEYAFVTLDLNQITLDVFDFNLDAIATYEKIGFVEYQFSSGARQFKNEKWNLIKMKLNKDQWLHKKMPNCLVQNES